MVVQIRVEATKRGLNQVTKKLEPAQLRDRIYLALEDILDELKRLVARRIPRDTGAALDGLYTEINGTETFDLNGVVANTEPYFFNLNEGRRAGAAMPPHQPIAEWAERHGIEEGAVYAIRRRISERGIPGIYMMQRALEEGRQHFTGVFFKRFFESWHR